MGFQNKPVWIFTNECTNYSRNTVDFKTSIHGNDRETVSAAYGVFDRQREARMIQVNAFYSVLNNVTEDTSISTGTAGVT